MNPDRDTIAYGMIVMTVLVCLYDLYLSQDKVEKNTYSEILRGWFAARSWLYYLVSFALGVLMAHWGVK